MNRLWNPTTTVSVDNALIWNGDPDNEKSPLGHWKKIRSDYGFNDANEANNYTIFQSIDYVNSDEPKIDDMGAFDSYSIKYYNPYTLQVIYTSGDDTGPNGHLRLKEVPELNFSLPYVLFKIERNGGSISNLAAIPNENNHSNNRYINLSNQTAMNVEDIDAEQPIGCVCGFFPNPLETVLYVNCSIIKYDLKLFDANGKQCFSSKNSGSQIQFGNLASGVYTLKITTESCVITQRIVKL